METEEQQAVQQETQDAVLSRTDLATTAPVPEAQSPEQSAEPEEEDSISEAPIPEAQSVEDTVSSDESQMGSMPPEEEADAGVISPEVPVVEEQEQVPETEPVVLIVPVTEPEVSVVPEAEPNVLTVPETEPSVSIVPDTEPSDATPDESGSDNTVISTPVQENSAGMTMDADRPSPETESVSVEP